MHLGKIVCVVGAPRTGKSFLVKKLAEHFGASAYYEGEDSDFPDRIKEDIAQNIRPLERALWFRNRLIEQYRQALDVKYAGGVAIVDTVYLIDLYVDVLTSDPFEREVLHQLAASDIKMFGFPDKIIHLTSSEEKIKELIKEGGREFDAGEGYYANYILPIQNGWSAYLSTLDQKLVLTVDRAQLDFNKPEDLESLTRQLS